MDTKLIQEAVERAIKKNVEKEFDEAMSRLNARKNEIVSGVLLNVMKMVNFDQRGETIVFTIKEIKA